MEDGLGRQSILINNNKSKTKLIKKKTKLIKITKLKLIKQN